MEFWFEFASTYSYPCALRIEALAREAGIAVAWRPFLLGPIFGAQGWNDSPFNIYPEKGRYMWRDLERTCAELRLPFRRPSQFPRNGLLAARIACAFQDEPWAPDFVREVYRANFARDRDIASPDEVGAALEAAGQPRALLAHAELPDVKAKLRAQTERARELGIFGAPSFVVGSELYWGNDRLEAALDRARNGGFSGRRLGRDEISRVWEIDRGERIERVYRVVEGELVRANERHDVKGWPPGEAEKYGPILEACWERGGFFYALFDGGEIVGVVVLDNRWLGEARDQLQLEFLHVSRRARDKGLGRALFARAAGVARERGARRLYVSATPSEHTIDFYRAQGCRLAAKPDPELFALEPEDIHLECDLVSSAHVRR